MEIIKSNIFKNEYCLILDNNKNFPQFIYLTRQELNKIYKEINKTMKKEK